MARLAGDINLRRSIGLAGQLIAKQRFSVQQYLSRLYEVYGIRIPLSSAAVAGASR
jgi:hypothetical protein